MKTERKGLKRDKIALGELKLLVLKSFLFSSPAAFELKETRLAGIGFTKIQGAGTCF